MTNVERAERWLEKQKLLRDPHALVVCVGGYYFISREGLEALGLVLATREVVERKMRRVPVSRGGDYFDVAILRDEARELDLEKFWNGERHT